jgi:hypothetical protein
MLSDQLREGFFGIVPLEEFGDFNGLGRFIEFRACGGNLSAANHVSSDNGKERWGASRDLRAELLLEHLQEVPFGEIHLENGMQSVIPHVGLGTHWHRE